jgi:hypothetical protein
MERRRNDPLPPEMPRVTAAVSVRLLDRVNKAARKMEQSVASYTRMALLEKLERDGQ